MVERRWSRYFWPDPRVLLAPDPPPRQFRDAMSAIHVGDTLKITDVDRHSLADELLLRHLDLTDAVIVDIGASDGSTALDLIAKLPRFRRYTIADLFLYLTAAQMGGRLLLWDHAGTLVLVAGRRWLAWPRMSRAVRWACLPWVLAAQRAPRQAVLLLNPQVRQALAEDPRLTYAVHDVFQRWPGSAPDVIKVANLLRRLYFDDDRIAAALTALLQSLTDGGYLLIVDNPRERGAGMRGGLYQRTGDRFCPVERTEQFPEIDELVLAARLPATPHAPDS